MSSRNGIWQEINPMYIDDNKLMKGVKNKWEEEKNLIDHTDWEELMRYVLSMANGKSYGMRNWKNQTRRFIRYIASSTWNLYRKI